MSRKPDTNHLLYHPSFEHDSCGVGFVANINGTPSHWILEKAVEAVVNLTHRGAVDADAKIFKPLHKAVRNGDYQNAWREYVKAVETRSPMALRDMLEFSGGDPIPLAEVEAVESIFPRFTTAGMSLGALSKEAHETLTIAMNRIGGRSNSGEGGEDKRRYHRLPNGDWPISMTKQVASARFGVTPEYPCFGQRAPDQDVPGLQAR